MQRELEEDLSHRESVAIEADVRKINWKHLGSIWNKKYGKLFTVIIMDPPWQVNLDLK